MVESDRLDYIRKHQKDLRVDLYSGLTDAITEERRALHRRDGEVFHIKLDKLMRILKDKKILGSIKADVYTVEFQKIGLPHAHIILWLFEADKLTSPFDVDQLISAEIPDKLVDLNYEKGYPTYRRRNDGRTVSRKGVKLDNRFVVPYNARLLKLFCGHLNIEKTNQSRVIKYCSNTLVKGMAVSFWYVSSCEASWRIFGLKYTIDIHCGETQFSSASTTINLLHSREKRFWKIRERDFSVGRIGHCTPAQGELYYLRLLLTKISSADKEAAGLSIIEKLLLRNGRSLNDYPSLPTPDIDNIFDISNQLILQELNYNKLKEREESKRLQRLMTAEQKQVFDEIMGAVSSKKDGFFFLHGFGGTGKTFIWNAFTASVRSNEGIILNVASSGIAATLLPSDRTAHSRLCIPIDVNEDPFVLFLINRQWQIY
ncbi:hypothetical protein K1719_045424 [Acacia pycnantha]|nr:hypothetical protein K1719_045424 [Acacia pycnantha]